LSAVAHAIGGRRRRESGKLRAAGGRESESICTPRKKASKKKRVASVSMLRALKSGKRGRDKKGGEVLGEEERTIHTSSSPRSDDS